jgi:hypothetical protein
MGGAAARIQINNESCGNGIQQERRSGGNGSDEIDASISTAERGYQALQEPGSLDGH